MDNQRDRIVKISFLGDITLDRPMLQAARQKGGAYDFSGMLEALFPLLSESDCVIGNLETVFAGEEQGFNPGILSYNSPDSLLTEIKKLGDPLVLGLANNHCLDMGIPGLKRTMSQLEQHRILYTGAGKDREKAFLSLNLQGLRLALFSYTSMMNTQETGLPHSAEELRFINSLFSPDETAKVTWKRRLLCSPPARRLRRKIFERRKSRGQGIIRPYSDENSVSSAALEEISGILKELDKAKESHDLVIVCLHSGGQFNEIPGAYTEALVKRLTGHADIIAGHHPHVVQRLSRDRDFLCAYSLGSLNMSPGADYIVPNTLSAYSMALHVYICRSGDGPLVKRASCSFLKAVEDNNSFVRVIPAAELYHSLSRPQQAELEKDIAELLIRCGLEQGEKKDILQEYEILPARL